MRRSFFIPLVAFSLLATARTAIAQRPGEARGPDRLNSGPVPTGRAVVGRCCNSTLTEAEAARVAARVAAADALSLEGRLAEAKRLLQLALIEQKRGGAYPAVTLRMLANVEFALDRPVAAAAVLRQLAFEAARVADPETELRALVDALVIYGQVGRRASQRELIGRIQFLLASPGISDSTRKAYAPLVR